jgi:hypothetical protein
MNEYKALVKLNGQGKTKIRGVKPVPMPLRPPQISDGLESTLDMHTEKLAITHSHYSAIFTVDTWLSRGRVVNSFDMLFGLIYKIVVHTLFPT